MTAHDAPAVALPEAVDKALANTVEAAMWSGVAVAEGRAGDGDVREAASVAALRAAIAAYGEACRGEGRGEARMNMPEVVEAINRVAASLDINGFAQLDAARAEGRAEALAEVDAAIIATMHDYRPPLFYVGPWTNGTIPAAPAWECLPSRATHPTPTAAILAAAALDGAE